MAAQDEEGYYQNQQPPPQAGPPPQFGGYTSGGGMQTGGVYNQYAPQAGPSRESPWQAETFTNQAQRRAGRNVAPRGGYNQNWYRAPPVQPSDNRALQPPAGAPPPGGQQAAPPPPLDTSNWDTDAYSAPGWQTSAQGGAMAGWDQSKWADPLHQTPKYAVGRILSQFRPDDAGWEAAAREIQRLYPGTQILGNDKLAIPGVGVIDVREGADIGGKGWRWGTEAMEGGDAEGGMLPPGGDDAFMRMMAQLMMPQQQGPDPAMMSELEALRKQVGELSAYRTQQETIGTTRAQEQQAYENAQRNRGPGFTYY